MDLQVFAQSVFDAQPFTTFLGAELGECGPGVAEIRIPLLPHHLQQHGFVHGGVLSYLADNTITFAGGLALGGNALTSEYKINYMRPARGQVVVARAMAKGHGKRQAVCQCDIFAVSDGVETLCAVAQGTVIAAKTP